MKKILLLFLFFGFCLYSIDLFDAAAQGKIDVVKAFLENGSSVNDKNEYGYTPLHLACKSGNFDLIKFLVEKGARINEKNDYGYTALHIASILGNLDIVKFLVENGANVNSTSTVSAIRLTPLDLAGKKRNWDVARYLIENGAKAANCDMGYKEETKEFLPCY